MNRLIIGAVTTACLALAGCAPAGVGTVALAPSAQTQTGLGLGFGASTVAGAACEGTSRVTFEAGVWIVTIRFEGYRAAVPGPDGGTFARATCNAAIPVDVPAGLSVAVVGTEYQLAGSIRAGTTAVVSLEPFFAGAQGPVLAWTLAGPLGGTFTGSTNIPVGQQQWSACGQDVILRANSSVRLTAERTTGSPTTTNLDLVRVRLVARSC